MLLSVLRCCVIYGRFTRKASVVWCLPPTNHEIWKCNDQIFIVHVIKDAHTRRIYFPRQTPLVPYHYFSASPRLSHPNHRRCQCPPLPILDQPIRVKRLLALGVKDIQLRIKGASPEALDAEISTAAAACRASTAATGAGRLWVNDFWREAIKHGAYGVHLGQEDLEAGGGEALAAIAAAGLRLGVSTHSYLELARATAVRPSYISLGPVFETISKKVAFSPRGAGLVRTWRALVDARMPLIAIGGITLGTAPQVSELCWRVFFLERYRMFI